MQTSSRTQALLAAFAGFLGSPVEFFKPLDMGLAGIVPAPPGGQVKTRCRVPHSNRSTRLHAGIPHGYSGAKLARKAMAGRITLRG